MCNKIATKKGQSSNMAGKVGLFVERSSIFCPRRNIFKSRLSRFSGDRDSDMDLESNGTDLNNSNFKSELYLAQVLSQRSLSQVFIPIHIID